LIMVHESAAAYEISKPVICSKCNRGRIGNIPEWSEAALSRRGKPPTESRGDGFQVKCPICGALWTLTME
jgi:hypothetical protein